ncbi:MAG: universal stress protein [Chlorobiaceae bacterium]|nr:universal stress protein [Chlorobiaceae bacterium]NTV16938.1 universal stress protein [Chlorobiaceae bacterium]
MRLLVAIDFSELADRIIGEAEKLARNLSAKIFLLHVIPPPSPIIELLPDAETLLPPGEPHGKESALPLSDTPESEKLLAIAAKLQESGIDTTVIIAQNNEVTAIIDESEKNDADMIMLGSHGHGALFHLLIGSVSEGVIRQASCPVIIVPAKK